MGRHRSFKLRWSKYYQYLLEGQIFYLKLKAYTNKNEGVKEWELITEQTYKDAVGKREYKDIFILDEEVIDAPVQALTLIFNVMYGLKEIDMRQAVMEGQESVRELRKHVKVLEGLEYRIFKRVMELKVRECQYKEAM